MLLQIPEGSVHKSDMLPNGWSDGGGIYSLMYQRIEPSDPATYLLKVIIVEGMLLVHLLVSTSHYITFSDLQQAGSHRHCKKLLLSRLHIVWGEEGGRLVTVAGVCRRHLWASVALHG